MNTYSLLAGGGVDRHSDYEQRRFGHLLMHYAPNGTYGPGGRDTLIIDRGQDACVWDTRGRRYFDGLSGLFCAQLGYSYGKEFADAIGEQLERLPVTTNYTTAHPAAIDVATRLAELAPGALSKVFLVSGGSEAVEAAWKIARQYFVLCGQPARRKVIARRFAYHGSSLGALAFTGVTANKEMFGTPAIPVRHVSTTNPYRQPDGSDESAFCRRLLAEIDQAIQEEGPDSVAVIVAEPVQNPGGCIPPPAGYWEGLRALADRYGILLWADEVISGCGRIGEWFASARYGGHPDIVTLAKGLSAGYAPAGAVLITDAVAQPLLEPGQILQHGFTFGGNPLTSAVILKTIEVFGRDGILDHVRGLEGHLRDRMRELLALPVIGDIRGDGFFWAAELIDPQAPDGRFDPVTRDRLLSQIVAPAMLEAGLLVRAEARAEDPMVQIAPPLVCDRATLDRFVGQLGEVLAAIEEPIRRLRRAGAA